MSKIAYVVSAIPKVPNKHFVKSAHSSDFKYHRLYYAIFKTCICFVGLFVKILFIKKAQIEMKNILKEKYEKILF